MYENYYLEMCTGYIVNSKGEISIDKLNSLVSNKSFAEEYMWASFNMDHDCYVEDYYIEGYVALCFHGNSKYDDVMFHINYKDFYTVLSDKINSNIDLLCNKDNKEEIQRMLGEIKIILGL